MPLQIMFQDEGLYCVIYFTLKSVFEMIMKD